MQRKQNVLELAREPNPATSDWGKAVLLAVTMANAPSELTWRNTGNVGDCPKDGWCYLDHENSGYLLHNGEIVGEVTYQPNSPVALTVFCSNGGRFNYTIQNGNAKLTSYHLPE